MTRVEDMCMVSPKSFDAVCDLPVLRSERKRSPAEVLVATWIRSLSQVIPKVTSCTALSSIHCMGLYLLLCGGLMTCTYLHYLWMKTDITFGGMRTAGNIL